MWVMPVMMRVVSVFGALLARRQPVPVVPGAAGGGGGGRRGGGCCRAGEMMVMVMVVMVVVVMAGGRWCSDRLFFRLGLSFRRCSFFRF